nr:hypothetical protein [Tanacetum cinerariifolium]
MTTPHPTPFSTTTPRAGVLTLFVIISDSDDEITTLPIRPAPSSPDCKSALYGYPLDSYDDLSDEDLSETADQPGKEILMPLGYKAAMIRWRTAPSSTCTMTTPHLTHFSTTTPRAGVLTLFVIISDSNDEITTLPIRPAPSSPDRKSALYGYPLDSYDDLSDEDLSETAEC